MEARWREGRRLAGVLIDDGHDVDRSTIGVVSNWKSAATPSPAHPRSAGSVRSRCRVVCVAAGAVPASSFRATAAGSSCGSPGPAKLFHFPLRREISRARRLGANPYGLKFVPLPVRPFPPAVDGVPSFSRYASRMDRALMVSW